MKIVTGLILSPVANEFAFKSPFLKLGQTIGLLVGAVIWGVGSDVWGRKCASSVFLLKFIWERALISLIN